MTKRGTNSADAEEWFREVLFRRDVLNYLQRQSIIRIDQVAALTDLTSPSIRGFLNGGALTIRTLAALARLCDLDLNVYVLSQSEHDEYLDSQHTIVLRANVVQLPVAERE